MIPSGNIALGDSSTFVFDQQPITPAPNEAGLETDSLLNGEHDQSWDADLAQIDHTEEMVRFHSPESFSSIIQYDLDLSFPVAPPEDNLNTLVTAVSASVLPAFTNRQIMSSLSPRLPTPVPNWVIASPPTTTADADSAFLSDGCQTTPTQELEPMSGSSKITFCGTDPESIIPAVLMMRKLFHLLQTDAVRKQHISLRGISARQLHNEIRSQKFLSRINEIAAWAYDASAKMLQQQIAGPQSPYMEAQPFSESCDKYSEEMLEVQAQGVSNRGNSAILCGNPISYCNIRAQCTTGGTLQIQLRQGAKGISGCNEDGSQNIIAVSVIPEPISCTETGIHITIPTIPRRSQGLTMYIISLGRFETLTHTFAYTNRDHSMQCSQVAQRHLNCC